MKFNELLLCVSYEFMRNVHGVRIWTKNKLGWKKTKPGREKKRGGEIGSERATQEKRGRVRGEYKEGLEWGSVV